MNKDTNQSSNTISSRLPHPGWAVAVKRAIDLTGALIFMPLLLILFAVAGTGIKLSSPGPVLFRQKRFGLHGNIFTMYKFRTMYKDADQRKEELRKFNIIKGPAFKLENDPRVFPFGRFLRRFSLDEFPQFYNVLKGEMSMVGPRPLPLAEGRRLEEWQQKRLNMKPGLTCLWQVRGRSTIKKFDTWARMDLEYIDAWSLALDLKILIKTVWVVLTGYGAN